MGNLHGTIAALSVHQKGMQDPPRIQVTVLFAELRATEENSLNDEYSERKAN